MSVAAICITCAGANASCQGNVAESLLLAFDAGAKCLLLPGEREGHPGEVFAKFQTVFEPTPWMQCSRHWACSKVVKSLQERSNGVAIFSFSDEAT